MELLIELVEKRKLLINDISIAEVTDEYMRTVSAMQEMSLPHTSHFVSLAATLLLIKSKSLLPVLDLTEEEEASIEDLEDRLKKYKVYRDVSEILQKRFGKTNLYEPEYNPPHDPIFVTDKYCDLNEIEEAMHRILNDLPKAEKKTTVKVQNVISLEEMIGNLQSRIEQRLQTKFSELRAGEKEHKNVIVCFLAILEIFKQGNIIITQEDRFDDINMELDKAETPRYY